MEIKLSKRELKLIKEFEKELADIKRRELIEAPLLKHIRNIEKTRNLNSGEGKVYIYIKVSPFEWRPYKHTFRSHLGASMFADVYFKNTKYKTVSEHELKEQSKIREQNLKKTKKLLKNFLENTAREYRTHYDYNLRLPNFKNPYKPKNKKKR